ncbi:HEPN domain-containing protein [Fimbriiglobus ruber]|uniref:Uncharacterized protein n=1 Tax=Fimbriiglobus ruber TaxID=1908690 RepID=A0A225DJX6_9BACT|nr:HEPN domain-containing protein [Fimbriiglobus ruber]OWK36695.1 hypothetical protein FRUB_09258 [Fimbriiglobus ruber]
MKKFECTGFWWIPEREDYSVAGTLHVSNDGELRLSLIGLIGSEETFSGKNRQIVLGSVDNSPSGTAVTLTGCFLTSTSAFSATGSREDYRASRAYFGAHLKVDGDFRFQSFLLKLGGLSAWAHTLSGLHREAAPLPTSKYRGQTVPLATYRVPNPLSGRLTDATITLNMGVSSKSEAEKFTFREQANFFVELDETHSVDQIEAKYVYPLRNLLTFAADAPQNVDSFVAWRTENQSDTSGNPEIRVVFPRVHPDAEGKKAEIVRKNEMLFTLADVDLVPFIEKWLRLSDIYSGAFTIFFGIQYGPPSYIDMTYTLLVQVLALYYANTKQGLEQREEEERRLKSAISVISAQDAEWIVDHIGVRPYPTFKTLLRRLIEQYGVTLDPILSKRRDAFVNQAISTLQYIERRNPEGKIAASHGSELYWLIQKIKFLIKTCILAESGFSPNKINDILLNNTLFQHLRELETEREKKQSPP